MSESIQKLPVVLSRVGISRSNLLALVKDGRFPAPIKLSARSVGWLASEIDDFIARKSAERNAPASE